MLTGVFVMIITSYSAILSCMWEDVWHVFPFLVLKQFDSNDKAIQNSVGVTVLQKDCNDRMSGKACYLNP